jgi:F0F1-type ATP synthase membrane subunit b/b'
VEFNFERIAMTAALICMVGAIVAKMVTMQLIKVMRKAIEVVNQSRLEAVRELNKAQSKKNVSGREQLKLEGKRKKIRTKLRKLKGELSEFKKAESEKQKQRAAMRGKVE